MYYIGIDLGGTNIKGALVSETGEIAREVSRPTRVELGAEAVCDGIAAVITELSSGVDRTSLGGVGLGCPGTVDDETGCVLYANNLGWTCVRRSSRARTLTCASATTRTWPRWRRRWSAVPKVRRAP